MPSERMPQADPSWMARPLEWLTRSVIRFPSFTLAIAGAAVVASVWLTMTQMGFRTSRAELLDPKSDYNRRWLKYTEEFGSKEDVVVVVESDRSEQVIPALDDVAQNLAKRKDLFGAVLSLRDADAPRLRGKGLYYLKPEELQQIDGFLDQAQPILQGNWSQLNIGGMAQWMGAAMSGGSDAQRQQIMAAMQSELPRVTSGLAAALGQSGGYKSPWPEMTLSRSKSAESAADRLLAEDGRLGFVVLRFLEEDRQSFAQNNESIKVLRQINSDVQARHPGVKIGLTGLPIIEFDEMQSSEQSMSAATFLSFAGVLAVMIIAFGGFRHSILAMAALVAGTIWACGVITLTIGYVNVLSIAFASILFGMGIDYGIYYVSRYLQLREHTDSTSEALIRTSGLVGPGILTGALTSAISFFAAGLTEFPGVSQLGVIAGGGVLLCWLGETAVLPAMIRMFDSDGAREKLPEPLNLRFWLAPLFYYPRLSLAVSGALTIIAAIGIHYLRYDYNLLNLQPTGLECVELEHKLFNLTNRSAWFALSIAQTPEEAAAKKEAFLKLPSVERVVEIASAIPANLDAKRPIIERIHGRLKNLPQQAPQIPVTPPAALDEMLAGAQTMLASQPAAAQAAAGLEQLRNMLRQFSPNEYNRRVSEYQQNMASDLLARLQKLQASSEPQPPQLTDLPESVRTRFIGKSGSYLLQVYSKANIWEVGPMSQFVHEIRSIDPEATGNPLQVYEASRHMKRSFEQAAWYALIAIVPLVFLDFRRVGHTLLAALPMGIGMLQTLGFMGLLNIPLNPANMIVLPLMLGLGMDTGINLIHEMRCHRGSYRGASNPVIVAVVVNTLTTMVGFGALMVANHQGLQSLGRVLTIAMGFNMLNSLLLPNLLVVGGFAPKSDEQEDDEYDENSTLAVESSSASYAA